MVRSNPRGEQSNPVPSDDVQAVGDTDDVREHTDNPVTLDEQEVGGDDQTGANTDEEFEPYVEWTGSAGYREVTAEQFNQAGVPDQETLVWTREQPRIPLSRVSREAQQALAAEQGFNFVTEDPKEND